MTEVKIEIKRNQNLKSKSKCIYCNKISDKSCSICSGTIGINSKSIIFRSMTETLVFCSPTCLQQSGIPRVKSKKDLSSVSKFSRHKKRYCFNVTHLINNQEWCATCFKFKYYIKCSFCKFMNLYKGYCHKTRKIVCCELEKCQEQAQIYLPGYKEGNEYKNYNYLHREFSDYACSC